uniref:G_PROTEIN_RECEP_F1_2 domain-containing protein n=1 Tax=Rhabditophanes sp. KR3021 TaxID=114890 RepID=A0AC35U0V5_9BILA
MEQRELRVVPIPWCALFGSLFSLLTIIGLLGNSAVILVIGSDKSMRKSCMNLLLLNLAVADALNLIVSSVEWTHTIIRGYPGWVFPSILCPIARYLECVFLFSSIMTQLIVCVERYIAIIYPLHARRLCRQKNVIIIIITMWVFVGIAASPYGVVNITAKQGSICYNYAIRDKWFERYKYGEFLAFYFIPAIIFIILYSKVAIVLWMKNKHLFEETRSSIETQAKSDALQLRRNIVKMLVACVCVYFICYSPIQGIFLSQQLFNLSFSIQYEFILLMNALAMTCSACNPLLYTLFSRKFRQRIYKVITCSSIKSSRERFKTLRKDATLLRTRTRITNWKCSSNLVIDNDVSNQPEVDCNIDSINVLFKTQKPFSGRVYVDGETYDKACVKSFTDLEAGSGLDSLEGFSFKIPFGACNMRRQRTLSPRGVSFSFSVIVSFHPVFVTQSDKAFKVKCFFMEAVKAVDASIEVSKLTTQLVENTFRLPDCSYSLRHSVDGAPLEFANVGQPVTHVWQCSQIAGYVYGMLIHSCFVEDGSGNRFELVDNKGCAIDHYLLSELQYDPVSFTAYSNTHVFKYADRVQLFFTCTVQLCYKEDGGCNGITPPSCSNKASDLVGTDFGGIKSHRLPSPYQIKGEIKPPIAHINNPSPPVQPLFEESLPPKDEFEGPVVPNNPSEIPSFEEFKARVLRPPSPLKAPINYKDSPITFAENITTVDANTMKLKIFNITPKSKRSTASNGKASEMEADLSVSIMVLPLGNSGPDFEKIKKMESLIFEPKNTEKFIILSTVLLAAFVSGQEAVSEATPGVAASLATRASSGDAFGMFMANAKTLLALVPTELTDFAGNLTMMEKIFFVQAGANLKNKTESTGELTQEDVIAELTKMDKNLVAKFKALAKAFSAKKDLLSEGAKTYFSEQVKVNSDLIKRFVNKENVEEKELLDISYKSIADYLALTDDDRNSFGKALPTLNNFFNNPIVINELKKITATSTLADYEAVNKVIGENLLKGAFIPTPSQ